MDRLLSPFHRRHHHAAGASPKNQPQHEQLEAGDEQQQQQHTASDEGPSNSIFQASPSLSTSSSAHVAMTPPLSLSASAAEEGEGLDGSFEQRPVPSSPLPAALETSGKVFSMDMVATDWMNFLSPDPTSTTHTPWFSGSAGRRGGSGSGSWSSYDQTSPASLPILPTSSSLLLAAPNLLDGEDGDDHHPFGPSGRRRFLSFDAAYHHDPDDRHHHPPPSEESTLFPGPLSPRQLKERTAKLWTFLQKGGGRLRRRGHHPMASSPSSSPDDRRRRRHRRLNQDHDRSNPPPFSSTLLDESHHPIFDRPDAPYDDTFSPYFFPDLLADFVDENHADDDDGNDNDDNHNNNSDDGNEHGEEVEEPSENHEICDLALGMEGHDRQEEAEAHHDPPWADTAGEANGTVEVIQTDPEEHPLISGMDSGLDISVVTSTCSQEGGETPEAGEHGVEISLVIDYPDDENDKAEGGDDKHGVGASVVAQSRPLNDENAMDQRLADERGGSQGAQMSVSVDHPDDEKDSGHGNNEGGIDEVLAQQHHDHPDEHAQRYENTADGGRGVEVALVVQEDPHNNVGSSQDGTDVEVPLVARHLQDHGDEDDGRDDDLMDEGYGVEISLVAKDQDDEKKSGFDNHDIGLEEEFGTRHHQVLHDEGDRCHRNSGEGDQDVEMSLVVEDRSDENDVDITYCETGMDEPLVAPSDQKLDDQTDRRHEASPEGMLSLEVSPVVKDLDCENDFVASGDSHENEPVNRRHEASREPMLTEEMSPVVKDLDDENDLVASGDAHENDPVANYEEMEGVGQSVEMPLGAWEGAVDPKGNGGSDADTTVEDAEAYLLSLLGGSHMQLSHDDDDNVAEALPEHLIELRGTGSGLSSGSQAVIMDDDPEAIEIETLPAVIGESDDDVVAGGSVNGMWPLSAGDDKQILPTECETEGQNLDEREIHSGMDDFAAAAPSLDDQLNPLTPESDTAKFWSSMLEGGDDEALIASDLNDGDRIRIANKEDDDEGEKQNIHSDSYLISSDQGMLDVLIETVRDTSLREREQAAGKSNGDFAHVDEVESHQGYNVDAAISFAPVGTEFDLVLQEAERELFSLLGSTVSEPTQTLAATQLETPVVEVAKPISSVTGLVVKTTQDSDGAAIASGPSGLEDATTPILEREPIFQSANPCIPYSLKSELSESPPSQSSASSDPASNDLIVVLEVSETEVDSATQFYEGLVEAPLLHQPTQGPMEASTLRNVQLMNKDADFVEADENSRPCMDDQVSNSVATTDATVCSTSKLIIQPAEQRDDFSHEVPQPHSVKDLDAPRVALTPEPHPCESSNHATSPILNVLSNDRGKEIDVALESPPPIVQSPLPPRDLDYVVSTPDLDELHTDGSDIEGRESSLSALPPVSTDQHASSAEPASGIALPATDPALKVTNLISQQPDFKQPILDVPDLAPSPYYPSSDGNDPITITSTSRMELDLQLASTNDGPSCQITVHPVDPSLSAYGSTEHSIRFSNGRLETLPPNQDDSPQNEMAESINTDNPHEEGESRKGLPRQILSISPEIGPYPVEYKSQHLHHESFSQGGDLSVFLAQSKDLRRRSDVVSLSSVSSTVSPGSTVRGIPVSDVMSPNLADELHSSDRFDYRPPLFPRKGKDVFDNPMKFAELLSSELLNQQTTLTETTPPDAVSTRWMKKTTAASYNPESSVFKRRVERAGFPDLSPPGSPPEPYLAGEGDEDSFDGSVASPSDGSEGLILRAEASAWDMVSERRGKSNIMEGEVDRPEFVVMPGPRETDQKIVERATSSMSGVVSPAQEQRSSGSVASYQSMRRRRGVTRRLSLSSRGSRRRSHSWRGPGRRQHRAGKVSSARFLPSDLPTLRGPNPSDVGGLFPNKATMAMLPSQDAKFSSTSSLAECRSLPDLRNASKEQCLKIDRPLSPAAVSLDGSSFKPMCSSPVSQPQSVENVQHLATTQNRVGFSSSAFQALEGARLERHLMDFLSMDEFEFPAHICSMDEAVEYVAFVRWRQIVADWKYSEIFNALVLRTPSGHFESDQADMEGSLATSGCSSSWDFNSSRDAVKLNGVELRGTFASNAMKNLDGFSPQHGESNLRSLTRYLTQGPDFQGPPTNDDVLRQTNSSTGDPTVEDLINMAEAETDLFSEIVKKIVVYASESNGGGTRSGESSVVFSVGIKDATAIEKKAARKYNGDILQVKDVLRAQIRLPNECSMVCGLLKLAEVVQESTEDRKLAISRVKNLFCRSARTLATGYRHLVTTIRMPNGLLAEIQWHLGQLFDVLGNYGYMLHREITELESACHQGESDFTWYPLDLELWCLQVAHTPSSREGDNKKAFAEGNVHEGAFIGLVPDVEPVDRSESDASITPGDVVSSNLSNLATPKTGNCRRNGETSFPEERSWSRGAKYFSPEKQKSFLDAIRSKSVQVLNRDVFLAVLSHGTFVASNDSRDGSAFFCLYRLISSFLNVDIEGPHHRCLGIQYDRLPDLAFNCLMRCCVIGNQATSTGMTGWLEYGSSELIDRLPERPLSVLHRLGTLACRHERLNVAESIFRCLLIKSEQQLPLYHPTTLISLMDLAAVLSMNGKCSEAKELLCRCFSRLSYYTGEIEWAVLSFFDEVMSDRKGAKSVFRIDSWKSAFFHMESFVELLQRGLTRELIDLIGHDHEVTLIHHGLLAEALAVLANCSGAAMATFGSSRTGRNRCSSFWRLACVHFRQAFDGLSKCRGMNDPVVYSLAYGMARCLRELGKRKEAFNILALIIATSETDKPLEETQSLNNNAEKKENALVRNHEDDHSLEKENGDVRKQEDDQSIVATTFLRPIPSPSSGTTKEDAAINIALCLWFMAVLAIEIDPDDAGRDRAFKLLHAASVSVQKALSAIPDDAVERISACVELLRKIEDEAMIISEPMEHDDLSAD